jgi:hypothetical protein
MNRMEIEAKSEECIDYDESQTTVSMKNAASLGECIATGNPAPFHFDCISPFEAHFAPRPDMLRLG